MIGMATGGGAGAKSDSGSERHAERAERIKKREKGRMYGKQAETDEDEGAWAGGVA